MKSSNSVWFTFTPRILKKPVVRWAWRIIGNSRANSPGLSPWEWKETRSPEFQRRNGVACPAHSGVTHRVPTSPSGSASARAAGRSLRRPCHDPLQDAGANPRWIARISASVDSGSGPFSTAAAAVCSSSRVAMPISTVLSAGFEIA